MKREIWFKAKTYGFGWYPCSWQGWLVTLIWLGFILLASIMMDHEAGKNILFMILLTVGLVLICKSKGEKAKWNWGQKSKK